ncbi:hypothetical protein CSOJ01_14144 [Colletotrichum sojae]|uniref:Rhamnogalacturonase A/B/Epimerase-like pectate lyase domain-containing protein n=1 Tax=Colletotrichum sojae TaxID=2175907 RepID=A0A8H6IR11_9PEZI|nr:hypothetical protein CSOJ01_14144 [Colletotrichum sojae]
MAVANALILDSPRPNVYSVWVNGNFSSSEKARRQIERNHTSNANSSSLAYTIPAEVIKASRILAEMKPPESPGDDYAALASSIKSRYSRPNDTNTMPQRMKRPSGLLEYVSPEEQQTVVQNGTVVDGTGDEHSQSHRRLGRATVEFWQEAMPQLGSSPFAPSGYKVWRNVKDYGAKGDGVTDDTAAIQLAISDGGRVYLGNQQFTISGLHFRNCQTALQIHWDWGFTMQSIAIEECDTGLVVVGGAGGPFSTGRGVGSVILADLAMHNVQLGISTSLFADNSTAFLIRNALFSKLGTAIMDSHSSSVLLPGGVGDIDVDSWGFGKVTDATGETGFVNGQKIESMTRAESLVSREPTLTNKPSFFTRRRPSYATLGDSQLVDVKAYGAKGDGTSDDTAVLNSILDFAANISAVVYSPFGVYTVTDTLEVPAGSHIIGQAWPQIMATDSLFADMSSPRAAVRVGDEGSVGAVEIQCMMFTVKGPTAGAVLMEWNIHESSQGSTGLWDSHFRVGGAIGSDIQVENCPTQSQNDGCVAASMLMHITTKASAYLENVWMWVADHDTDKVSQDQINIFSARGVLIESQGPTWLWGTSVEHNVLYQYQLSGAQDIVLGLVQTESPYFQVSPAAPAPFSNGLVFANDPDFSECGSSKSCAMSWGLRLVDSSTGRIFYVEQSYDIWIYGLVTIGNSEMITPFQGTPIVAKNNRNGCASSILAWLGGSDQTAGLRNFTGYQLYTLDKLDSMSFSHVCKNTLTASILCDDSTIEWTMPSYHGTLDNSTLQEQLCDVGCGHSLASWYDGVSKSCGDYQWPSGAPLNMLGGYVWYGYNETCSKDPVTGKFCSDVIDDFSLDDADGTIPTAELCSECYLGRLTMMQKSPYSIFGTFPWFEELLESAVPKCSIKVPTTPQDPLFPKANSTGFCVSDD